MNWLQKIGGNPYNGTLYHGTNKSFTSFDISFAGARDWGDFGIGFYLSTSPGLAISYAHDAVKNNGGGEPIIYVIRTNLKNMATFDELMEVVRSFGFPKDKELTPGEKQTRPEVDSKSITARMVELGFDGARVGVQVVVYDGSLLNIVRTVSPERAGYLPDSSG